MYIKRQAEYIVHKLGKMYGVVLVTGPRQVGKTTMLRNMYPDLQMVSMDDGLLCQLANQSPHTFMQDYKPPVIFDEIQKSPNLFTYIKLSVDKSHKKGQYFLTGSQQFQMMQHVSESLSGRVGIVTLLGFSNREIYQEKVITPFLPTDEFLSERKGDVHVEKQSLIWSRIHRGSMPEVVLNEDFDVQLYYSNYVRTYIERDVRTLTRVGDESKFMQFMVAVAAMTGQMLNKSSLAKEIGVSVPTIDSWLSILESSHIIYLLRPYYNNRISRAVKTPKIYFFDTGLCAYLTRWTSAEVLQHGAMAGAFFETFVVTEVLKSYYNQGIEPPVYYFRTRDGQEIDLLIEKSGVLYPIEIKKHADPKPSDLSSFKCLDVLSDMRRGQGAEVCLSESIFSLTESDKCIPIAYL